MPRPHWDSGLCRALGIGDLCEGTDPDLAAFCNSGGELLMWHGWSNPHISPANSLGYYEAVARLVSADQVPSFARLFLIPGLYHCSGGECLNEIDVGSALMNWVEHGKAPDSPQAHSAKESRLVFPYPDSATRSPKTGWQRVKGERSSKRKDWVGADFFKPGYELQSHSGLPSLCALP